MFDNMMQFSPLIRDDVIGCSFLQIHAPAAPVSMATVVKTPRGMGLRASVARVTVVSAVTCQP